MINQLRIYTVPKDNRGPFLDRFRDHAARIMGTYGFRIQAMWTAETDEALKFVYLLAWQDEADMAERWEAFMDDAEWAEVKRVTSAEHGTFVLGIDEMTLVPTEFSAAIGDRS